MARRFPWDLVPSLKRESLQVMGTVFHEARNRAAKDVSHMWDNGLTIWGLGAASYEYTRFAVCRAAASGKFPWLSIVDESAKFVFALHGVPFRFYRGRPDQPASDRHAVGSMSEKIQLEMTEIVAETEAQSKPSVFRFVVSTDSRGYAKSVLFARVTEADGKLHDTWTIPRLPTSAVAPAFMSTASLLLLQPQKPVTLPKPVYGGGKDSQEKKSDETKGA